MRLIILEYMFLFFWGFNIFTILAVDLLKK